MRTWIKLIIAYFITFAVFNIGGFESSDIMMGAVFIGTFMLLRLLPDGRKSPDEILRDSIYAHIRERAGSGAIDVRKLDKASRIVAFIWTLLYVIYLRGRIDRDLSNPLFRAVYVFLTVAGLCIVLYLVIRSVLAWVMSTRPLYVFSVTFPNDKKDVMSTINRFPLKLFLKYAGIIFLCMLPLFLLNAPGTLTVDSFDQLSQARGLAPYSDHHPWVHTLIIRALYNAGYALSGSVYGGIAFYTVTQMIVVSLAVAYSIVSLTEPDIASYVKNVASDTQAPADPLKAGRTVRILMLLGFVLYPYNLAYSITMWKDVLFSAAVLTLTVTIYRIWVRRILSVRDMILFAVSGLGMCMLRHNGLYAYILTMFVIFICEGIRLKKERKLSKDDIRIGLCEDPKKCYITVLAAAVIVLILTALVRGPVQKAANVESGDFAHNLPIPLQQVARVVYDGCELTGEEIHSLEKINSVEFLRTEYTPGGADPAVQWGAFGNLDENKAEFFAVWLKLMIKHPGEYILAFIDQTRGYYTTMAPEQTEYYGILPNEDGLEPQPVLGASVRIKINEICGKLHLMFPVYGILYSMGACFMLLIPGASIVILSGRKEKLYAYLPFISLMLTLMVAVPLCADLRYAYPLMLAMPALIRITLAD